MFTAFMVALTLMPVANVLVTMAVGPLLTALFARIFIGHRIALRTWVAIGLAGLGIGWMYGSQMAGLPLSGTLVALCVPVAAAANWTVVQHSQRHGHAVDLVPAVLVGAVVSVIVTLPLALPLQATAHDLGYAEQAVENFRANLDDAVFWTFMPLARPIWAVRGALRPDFRPYGRTCPNR